MLTRAQTLDRLHAHTVRRGVVTTAWLTEHDTDVYRGVLAHFGSIVAARRAGGIVLPSRRAWTASRVISELRRLQRGRQVRITTSGLRAAGHYMLLAAIYKLVGSIGRARRLARIPQPGAQGANREPWDEDRVIAEIRARHRRGASLGASKVPSKLNAAARRHCGSWQAAIELADLDYDATRMNRRPWTRADVLAWVKRAARKHMQTSCDSTMTALVAPIGRPMRGFFGDLEGALRAAHLDPARAMRRRRRERRSEAALVADLRAEVKKRSKITGAEFFRTRLGREAVARFGSWRAVIDRIGPDLWPARRSVRLPAAEEVIAGLQTRHRRGGTMALNATLHEEPRLANAAVKHFGSWRHAMAAAGLAALVGRRRGRLESSVR